MKTAFSPTDLLIAPASVRGRNGADVDLFGAPVDVAHGSVLGRAFGYPPFSVLDARGGWWQERKRQWLALGIQSEIGREDAGP